MAQAEHSTSRPTELLTPTEVGQILSACSRRAPTGIRDRALITTMYRSGMRVSEALRLKPSDIDMATGTVRVLHGKNDKPRTIRIGDGALAVIQLWLDARKQQGLAKAGVRLFCTLDGKPLSANQVRQMMHRRATRAGLDKRAHPHALRHARAFEMSEAGVHVAKIQQFLGHSHLSTTDTYIRHLGAPDVLAIADDWRDEQQPVQRTSTPSVEAADTHTDSAEANAAAPTPAPVPTDKPDTAQASSAPSTPRRPRRTFSKAALQRARPVHARVADVQAGQRVAFVTENKSGE